MMVEIHALRKNTTNTPSNYTPLRQTRRARLHRIAPSALGSSPCFQVHETALGRKALVRPGSFAQTNKP